MATPFIGCTALASACALLLVGCAALENVGEPPVTGDPPSTNAATTARQKDVPFCPGGDRAKACVFGQNCRITDQGCQVCQCHTME
ncbi:MAG TPA: hypothetical protein VFS67_06055 [Polyangiaceae bacterium]|jgi:hypothetical protein|nr:hypothetical protein [Polyangiaceae bacterium]